MIDGDEMSARTVLMNKADWDDWSIQDDIGQDLIGETVINGYKYKTILGRQLIVTIKNDIVPPGSMYFFADPQMLGNFYILNDTKFFIKKEFDEIEFQSWEYIAEGFGNIRGISKVVWDAATTGGDTLPAP